MTKAMRKLHRFWPVIKDRSDRYRLSNVQIEALEGCHFRGHKMSKFESVTLGNGTKLWRSECTCKECVDTIDKSHIGLGVHSERMYVDVLKRNSPNPYGLPAISGTAIALTCKGK